MNPRNPRKVCPMKGKKAVGLNVKLNDEPYTVATFFRYLSCSEISLKEMFVAYIFIAPHSRKLSTVGSLCLSCSYHSTVKGDI
jgi:hypothetical protein